MKAKINKSQYRSWPLTFLSTVLFITVVSGLVAVWRYIGHDLFIVFTVMIPTAFVAMFFLVSAINGRKQVVKEAFEGVLWLLVWWR